MRPLIFLLSLFLISALSAQDEKVIANLIENSSRLSNQNVENIEEFYNSFYKNLIEAPGAVQTEPIDQNKIYYFDLIFTFTPEYNLNSNCIDLNFNQPFVDPKCSNTKRNGLLLYEKEIKEVVSKKDKTEKIQRYSYLLIPDKCTSTRLYNSSKEMICDNKIRFKVNYDSAKTLLHNIGVRAGVSFISTEHKEFYEESVVQTTSSSLNIKSYAIRANIKSLVLYDKLNNNILDVYVSIK